MNLKRRLLTQTALAVTAMAFISYACLFYFGFRSASAFELADVTRNVENLLDISKSDLKSMTAVATDWAMWDATWNYVADRNPAYVAENMTEDTLQYLGLNFIAVFDDAGACVCGNFNGPDGWLQDVPPELAQAIAGVPGVLRMGGGKEPHSGLARLPVTMYALASSPVLPSSGEGEVRGTVVMGRVLDQSWVSSLSERSRLPVTLISAGDLPAGSRTLEATLSTGERILVERHDYKTLSTCVPLIGPEGDPIAYLRAGFPRWIFRQMMIGTLNSVIALGIAGAFLVFYLMKVQDEAVLSRLSSLAANLLPGSAAGGQPPATAGPRAHRDELAVVTSALRDMQGKLESSSQALQNQEHLLRLLATNSKDIIYRLALLPEARFEYISPAVASITGYSQEEVYRDPELLMSTLHPEDRVIVAGALDRRQLMRRSATLRFFTKDHRIVPLEQIVTPILGKDGRLEAVEGIARDVSDRINMEEELRYMNLHDPLTGLYNRTYFERELAALKEKDFPVAIVSADVDGLKLINDTLGHAEGNALLKDYARLMSGVFGDADFVARTSGSEFAAVLTVSGAENAKSLCEDLEISLKGFNLGKGSPPLGVSIGVGVAASPSHIPGALSHADTGMYEDKLRRRAGAARSIVKYLVTALGAKDWVSAGHTTRVSDTCLKLGRALGLPGRELEELEILAQVHDLGKARIPETVLSRAGPLTANEWKQLQQHVVAGYRIANASLELSSVSDLILHHHEWWDGSGYCAGLRGQDIPLACRILSIADAFDAMTDNRPYRRAMSVTDAVSELKRGAGRQFDPRLVDLFIAVTSVDPS